MLIISLYLGKICSENWRHLEQSSCPRTDELSVNTLFYLRRESTPIDFSVLDSKFAEDYEFDNHKTKLMSIMSRK